MLGYAHSPYEFPLVTLHRMIDEVDYSPLSTNLNYNNTSSWLLTLLERSLNVDHTNTLGDYSTTIHGEGNKNKFFEWRDYARN